MVQEEAELQATANLSPVSPSPLHTASPLLVPALQDTADTIDAMVAAVTAAAANGVADTAHKAEDNLGFDDIDNVVDDDSLNDPYGDDDNTDTLAASEPQSKALDELPDSNDDYAKTFDSPIGSEEVEGGEDVQPEDVSSSLRESNHISTASTSDRLTSHPSEIPSSHEPTSASAQHGAPVAPSALPDASPENPNNATAPSPSSEQATAQQPRPSSPNKSDSSFVESSNPAADIQRLVADLIAPAEPSPNSEPSSAKTEQPSGSSSLPSALPSSASLPPRPPLPTADSQSYATQQYPSGINSSIPVSAVAPPTPGQPSTYVSAGVPGAPTDGLSSLAPSLNTSLNAPGAVTSMNNPPYPSNPPSFAADQGQHEYQRAWNQFQDDERQYMSEAKWDRFPEGSRIFIGNLSSDKVSKRDVFDMFYRFGRLAQISLKSAYGFVQYHTVEEGRAAMEHLQGIEIKGRRIHLEVSRAQDKSKKERNRSPDRGRGRDSGRRNERYSGQGRDDYRPGGRNPSPRRNDYHRDDGYGRERGFSDGGRGRNRSRSPRYGQNDRDSYRRRSPSPYSRSRRQDDLDLPQRYGADVPDVQIILQPDVRQDFVAWVEGAFKAKGLRTEVMYLHPRIPKNSVIERQAAEGVHAVVDLDLGSQNVGRIPVLAFDRSKGISNVRFDQYENLDPPTAAEVILRAKASGSTANHGPSYGSSGGYNPPYGQHAQQAPPNSYHGGQPPNQYPPQQPPANNIDVAGLMGQMGQMDNATLQHILASIQTPGAAPPNVNHAPAAQPQVDIQAILGALSQNNTQQRPPYGAPYDAHPAANGAPDNGGQAAQVENIMSQLARFRQQ